MIWINSAAIQDDMKRRLAYIQPKRRVGVGGLAIIGSLQFAVYKGEMKRMRDAEFLFTQ